MNDVISSLQTRERGKDLHIRSRVLRVGSAAGVCSSSMSLGQSGGGDEVWCVMGDPFPPTMTNGMANSAGFLPAPR